MITTGPCFSPTALLKHYPSVVLVPRPSLTLCLLGSVHSLARLLLEGYTKGEKEELAPPDVVRKFREKLKTFLDKSHDYNFEVSHRSSIVLLFASLCSADKLCSVVNRTCSSASRRL